MKPLGFLLYIFFNLLVYKRQITLTLILFLNYYGSYLTATFMLLPRKKNFFIQK